MVKCVHRQIKDALCACGAGLAWHSHLPWVLLGLHVVPKEDFIVSSAELVQGHPFILPRQLLHVPDPPHVDVAPLPMKPASFGESGVHVLASWWPAEVASGPKCRPIQGAGQGGQDLQDPDRAKGGAYLSG
jgi:hypothetical protein